VTDDFIELIESRNLQFGGGGDHSCIRGDTTANEPHEASSQLTSWAPRGGSLVHSDLRFDQAASPSEPSHQRSGDSQVKRW
jgi:hypothetical protein